MLAGVQEIISSPDYPSGVVTSIRVGVRNKNTSLPVFIEGTPWRKVFN